MSEQPRSPDRTPLDVAPMVRRLESSGGLWTTIDAIDSVASSNALLSERASSGTAHPGSVLVAEEQTAGRGRQGRSWLAPKYSSLMVSALLRPAGDPSKWGWLPLVTALALSDAVERAGVASTIKWPNDLLIGARKVAGILCEVVQTPEGPALVAGWGLNVSQTTDELATTRATSIHLAGGATNRGVLLADSLAAWERWYTTWDGGSSAGLSTVSGAYQRRSSTLGGRVRADLPDGTVLLGVARGLDDKGRLVVDVGEREHTLAAADVIHLDDQL